MELKKWCPPFATYDIAIEPDSLTNFKNCPGELICGPLCRTVKGYQHTFADKAKIYKTVWIPSRLDPVTTATNFECRLIYKASLPKRNASSPAGVVVNIRSAWDFILHNRPHPELSVKLNFWIVWMNSEHFPEGPNIWAHIPN